MELSNLKGFVSTQLRQEIEGTDDIVIIDDPYSTTSGTKMKKKKKKTTKRLEDSNKESNASEVLVRSQQPPKWCRISSNRSSAALYKLPSPKDQQSVIMRKDREVYSVSCLGMLPFIEGSLRDGTSGLVAVSRDSEEHA